MNEYASNLSVFACAFLEFVLISYVYGSLKNGCSEEMKIFARLSLSRLGFNNFMEDIRMMLGKRPLEPYWFFTWCISGPIITLVTRQQLSLVLLLHWSLQVVFFTSIIRFRTPTEGNYVYPLYAHILGWLMVCSSLIFIPGVMIYELIKGWRITGRDQYQVNEPLSGALRSASCYQVNEHMPHYLRMLTYAIQPETEWGPAKNENRHGRYSPKIDRSEMNAETDSLSIFRIRL